jgi:hypothetical protein
MPSKSTLYVLFAAALVTAGCCPQDQCDALRTDVDALRTDVDSLLVRMADFHLWASGGRTPADTARPDPSDPNWQSVDRWLDKATDAICAMETHVSAPGATRLCPIGPGDPDGEPPPAPPFL